LPAPVSRGTTPQVGVAGISAAEKHAFARLHDGTVVAWGANDSGQLGDGTLTDRRTAVPVRAASGDGPLRGVTTIVAGEAYGVAVVGEAELLTWGAGRHGQLASGERASRTRPGPVRATPAARESQRAGITAVAAGERHLLVATRR
jgi:alpha-tubulin suppressor-like RCC1 family protein